MKNYSIFFPNIPQKILKEKDLWNSVLFREERLASSYAELIGYNQHFMVWNKPTVSETDFIRDSHGS